MTERKLSVAVDQEIIAELFHRGGPELDIEQVIGNVVTDYLERTDGDLFWTNPAYLSEFGLEEEADFVKEFGPPDQGYLWEKVFLPNGTRIKMRYTGKDHFAQVVRGDIFREGMEDTNSYTPSELARTIANHTNRNAWRDLSVKRPRDKEWVLVEDLRREIRR